LSIKKLKAKSKESQSVRIIGGTWRSRKILFAEVPGLRPTGDRIRETLFNWLATNISGAHCLDLFAGSGVLGFEALSRGAARCTSLESHPTAAKKLQSAKVALSADINIVNTNSLSFLAKPSSGQEFDIVFIDPPFEAGILNQSCSLLEENGWLAVNASIYCELHLTDNTFVPPLNWQQVQDRHAGQVRYCLFTRIEPSN
jgi:16S rRNA (guanine966-N2)-methyltransferase